MAGKACLSRAPSILITVMTLIINFSIIISLELTESLGGKCCSGDSVWESGTNCSDKSQIAINCTKNMFLVDFNDPEEEFTVFNENGSWIVFNPDKTRVPEDEFCVSNSSQSDKIIGLICFGEDGVYPPEWKYTLFGLFSLVSSCFLFVTLAIYLILPELRDIQDKAMMSTVSCLSVSYIILAIKHLGIESDSLCIPLAFFMYYTFLSAFFWLNLVAFNIWRLVCFKSFPIRENILFKIFCIVGWGVPSCFLIIAIILQFAKNSNSRSLFRNENCWFRGNYETLIYFYGPISILLTINFVYLGLTCWKLWNQHERTNRVKTLRFKCLLCIKLAILMGSTWIFEIITFYAASEHEAWILTDIINTLQGVFIFIIFVVMRKRVRKLLAEKKPLGIHFPESWREYRDEEYEQEEIIFPEEVELSRTA